MHKSVKADLEDAVDVLEHLSKMYPKMTLEEKVDVGARINRVAKAAGDLVDLIKADIKAKLKGKEGVVPGEMFNAVLSHVGTTRLDQQLLKVEHQSVYAECCKAATDLRITFEVR